MKKKIIVILIIVFSVLVVAGGGVAAFFIASSKEKTVSFEDDNNDDYKYKTTLKETPKDGSKPDDYDALTNVYYALYNLEHKEAFACTTTGTAKASVATQIISNSRVVIGDEALVSTISDGIVKVGTQKYFVNKGEKVLLRGAESISDAKAIWNGKEEPECITGNAYIGRYGWLPYKAIGYIICDDTVLEASSLKCENGIYEVTLNLDPDGEKAPYWYRREVATNGSSTMIPEFSLINLTYKFDSNWNVIEVHAQEKYLVKSMGIKTTCETNCYDSYSYENVSFDKDSYDFFQKYKNITASEKEDNSKVDALTLLTSSLLNNNSYESLGVSIKFNNKLVEGIAAIDISDLENVKVKVLAEDLYVEYSDLLYISLGDLKLKSDTETLKGLLNEFNGTIPNVEAIDTAAILAAFDNAKMVEENNETVVNVNFNLLGFDIYLEYSIYKDDVDYNLNYVKLNSEIDGNKVEIDAKPSEKAFPVIDKSKFTDLSNFDYLFNFFSRLIVTNSVNANISISNNDFEATIDLKGKLTDGLSIQAGIDLFVKESKFHFDITYLNDNIYISYDDINVMISKDDLLRIINKYAPNALSLDSINGTSIIETIMDLDFDKLFKEVIVTDSNLSITTNLEDLLGLKDDIILSISDGDDFNIRTAYKNLNISGSVKTLDDIEISLPDKNYSNLAYLEGFIDNVLSIFNNKKVEALLSLTYNDLDINALVKVDFNDTNNIKAFASVDLIKNESKQNIKLTYLNNVIYIDFADKKLSISVDGLKEALAKFDINLDSKMDLNEILNVISSINFEKLLSELTINENKIVLGLNLSDYISSFDDVKATITNNEDSINLSLNLYDLNANIKASDFDIALEGEYQSLDNILGFIDNIKDIIDNKKVILDLSAKYNDFVINGTVKVDFNDINNLALDADVSISKADKIQSIKLKSLNNNIYIDFAGQKLSISLDTLKKILNKFDIDLSNNQNIDIVDKLISLDYAKLLNEITTLDNELRLSLNLGDLISSLNNLNIIVNKNDDSLQINVDKYDIKANVKSADFDIALDGEYNSLDQIEDIIDIVKDVLDNKKAKINLDGKYKDISFNGVALIDFNESLKAKVIAEIEYKEMKLPLNLYYFSSYNDLKNVIYVDLNDIHGYITLDDLKNTFDFELTDPIEMLFNIDFASFIKNIKYELNSLNVGLDLNYLLKDVLSLDLSFNDLEASISKNNDHLNISSSVIDKLNIDLYSSFDEEISLPNNEYIHLETLISDVSAIINLVNKKSFRLDIDASANISNLVSLLSKDIKITGYVDFLYDNGYKINSNLHVQYDNINANVNIKYVDKYIYVNMLGINIKLAIDDVQSLIEEVMTKFNINDSSLNTSKDEMLNKVFDIIESAVLVDEQTLSVDLSGLFDKLSILTVKLIENNEKYSLNLDMDMLKCDIMLEEVDNYDLVYSDDYLEYNDILNLCDMIAEILDIAKNKEFNLNLDFSVYDCGKKHLDVDGSLMFKIYENGKFDLKASGTIIQYENNTTKYHILDLTLISKEFFGTEDAVDMVYITYGTVLNSSSKIKLYLPLSEVLDVAGTVSKLMGIDLSFLDKYSSFNFNDIDTEQVQNLISDNVLGKAINLDKVIKSFNATTGRLELGLNLGDLLPQPENNTVSLVVDTNDNGNIMASLSLENLYTVYHSISDNTMFNIDSITLVNDPVDISVPNTSDYYNLTDIEKLVNGLITTATFKDFEIKGTAKLNMLGLDLISLPIDIKINVDEDGKPIIHAYIDAKAQLARHAFGTKYLDIYFKDGFVYIKKMERKGGILNLDGDTYYLKVSQQTFLDDIVYYLLEFGLTATDTVMNNVNDDSNDNHVIDAGNVLNSYNHSGNNFTLGLSLKELTGSSMLGDATFTLALKDVITNSETNEKNLSLTSIKNLEVALLGGFINLTMDNLFISNIDNAGNVTTVDNSALDSFIENYNKTKAIDVIYKNNSAQSTISHKITFVRGIAGDNIEVTGITGDNISYPTMADVTYNGEVYKFIGWYTDKDLTEECILTKFDDDNHKLYAKYEKA